MELKVYLHRTKKKNFTIADEFVATINFDKIPEDKQNDIDYINKKVRDDCQKIALTRDCVKKYGTGYISFMRPQYEGPEEENGNDTFYFDNLDMIFKLKYPQEEPNEQEKLVNTIDTLKDLLNGTEKECDTE